MVCGLVFLARFDWARVERKRWAPCDGARRRRIAAPCRRAHDARGLAGRGLGRTSWLRHQQSTSSRSRCLHPAIMINRGLSARQTKRTRWAASHRGRERQHMWEAGMWRLRGLGGAARCRDRRRRAGCHLALAGESHILYVVSVVVGAAATAGDACPHLCSGSGSSTPGNSDRLMTASQPAWASSCCRFSPRKHARRAGCCFSSRALFRGAGGGRRHRPAEEVGLSGLEVDCWLWVFRY